MISADTVNTHTFRVAPGTPLSLATRPTAYTGALTKKEADNRFKKLRRQLQDLQELLYAEGRRSLLVVFQAMDAGGKDSTIRNVIGPLNPAGCRVTSFKVPNDVERRHDFLWRIHRNTPLDGFIRVFNRSHYEDVLVVRVKNLVPESVWSKRYEQINAFEKMLADEGTAIVKFFLHISKEYQKKRLQRRLDRPAKHWKFNPADLEERARWDEYQTAFEVALTNCSPAHAPWYVVPAETRWFRNLLVAQVLVEKLQSWEMQFPQIDFDPEKIMID